MFCRICGAQIEDNAEVCPACGAVLQEKSEVESGKDVSTEEVANPESAPGGDEGSASPSASVASPTASDVSDEKSAPTPRKSHVWIAVAVVAVVAVAAVALVVSGALGSKEPIVGRWEGVWGSVDDSDSMFPTGEVSVEINNDKTFRLDLFGEVYKGEWRVEGTSEEDGRTLYLLSPSNRSAQNLLSVTPSIDDNGEEQLGIMTEDQKVFLLFVRE